MNASAASLAEYVADDLVKLRARLSKEGFSDVSQLPYERYLNTALWGKIKAWIRARDHYCCRLCGTTRHRPEDLDVHHRSYDLATLEGRDDSKLMSLCRPCHQRIEAFPDGRRRTDLHAKEAELERLTELFRARDNGLLVALSEAKRRVDVVFVGDKRLLEIAPFWHFISGAMHTTWLQYENLLRMPLPFSHDKFFQPAGARLIHIPTNKPWLTFRAGETAGSIASHTGNEVAVFDSVKLYTNRAGQPGYYWRVQT